MASASNVQGRSAQVPESKKKITIPEGQMIINYDDDENDDTCCHRATFCNKYLREAKVDEPLCDMCDISTTWADLFWLVTCVAMVLMAWTTLYFLLKEEMLPGGSLHGLFVIVVSSYALGWTLAYVPYLNIPPVFGMLLAGIIIRNSNFYNIREELGGGTTSKIRTFCLTFIMIRAGFQLTTTALRENPTFIALLAIIPCSFEAITISCFARYLLQYSWEWAFLASTIVACMSPAVTINCVLKLAERGYGEDKGMASLICAATSIDNVHILSLYSIFFGILFSDDDQYEWWSYVPNGLRDLLLGACAGVILGTFLAFFPHRNHQFVMWYRFGAITLASLMCTMGSSTFGTTGGAYLATMLLSFIAIKGWRILADSYDQITLQKTAYFVWHFMQPILVGVIGADINIKKLSLSRLGLYCACIFVGLIVRCFFAILLAYIAKYPWKECIFIAMAWIPKGTLQAALAPMALEMTRKKMPEQMEIALDVVNLSVMTVMLLAPLGTIAVMASGPLLLNKISLEEHEKARRLSHLRMLNLQLVRSRKRPSIDPLNPKHSTYVSR